MFPIHRVATYDALIRAASQSFGVDPALLKAHVNRESEFNPHAYNPEGGGTNPSVGLAQVRLSTARVNDYDGPVGDSAALSGLYDPGTNLYQAAKLIAQNLNTTHGDVAAAISAYNGGYSRVRGYGYRRADGTFGNQGYVDDVLRGVQEYAADFNAPNVPQPQPEVPPPASGGLSTGAIAAIVALLAALALGVYLFR